MELYSRHPTALRNGRQAIMESLNEIAGRTTHRRPANPTQQLYPYQGQYPTAQSAQAEPASRPTARQRVPEQAPQSLPPNSSTRPEVPSPYGNDSSSRPNQQYYSHTTRNQRQSYPQEGPYNRFNGPNNSARSYEEQDGPDAQNLTSDVYRQNRSISYPPAGRTNEMNDGDRMYKQNAHMPTQYRQNYGESHLQQEPYFHPSDVTHYITQPGADVLDTDGMEDDDVLYMRDGDWEEDNNQILPYRRPETGSRAQTRRLANVYETAPAYLEQPTQTGHPTRNLYDIRNGAGENKRQSAPYGFQQGMEQARLTQPPQHYASPQVTPLAPVQPTAYISQGQPTPPARQGRAQQMPPPHPVAFEQTAPYQRITQPLNA